MNKAMSIYAVHIYKLYGLVWVFDDPAKEIRADAFIDGAGACAIDDLIKKKYNKVELQEKYIMRLSGNYFPGSHCIEYQPREGLRNNSIDPKAKEGMELVVDYGSYWIYNNDEGEHLLWLCDSFNEMYIGDDDKLIFFDIIKGDNE